jgi:hypothetical protein
MPRGSKSKYTGKQKRQAEHIEKSYEKRGVGKKTAEQRAWQTVNKQSGGGEKSGGGRKPSSRKKRLYSGSKESNASQGFLRLVFARRMILHRRAAQKAGRFPHCFSAVPF